MENGIYGVLKIDSVSQISKIKDSNGKQQKQSKEKKAANIVFENVLKAAVNKSENQQTAVAGTIGYTREFKEYVCDYASRDYKA